MIYCDYVCIYLSINLLPLPPGGSRGAEPISDRVTVIRPVSQLRRKGSNLGDSANRCPLPPPVRSGPQVHLPPQLLSPSDDPS